MKTFLSIMMVAIIGLTGTQKASAQDIGSTLKKVQAAVAKYDQIEYDFESKERRRNGSYITTIGRFKVWEGPNKKVAANLQQPDVAKITWKKGQNNNKASVKLGKLPWVNLATTNNKFLAKSHHTIDNSGFGLPIETITKIYNMRKDEVAGNVQFMGNVTFDGHSCQKIIINDPNHGTTSYTVKSGDNLIKIAHGLAINEMQILELNPKVKNYFDVEAGETITIPNSFGTKITIYLDNTLQLPRYFKVEDKKGVVGEYSHKNIDLNPQFTDVEFTKDGFK